MRALVASGPTVYCMNMSSDGLTTATGLAEVSQLGGCQVRLINPDRVIAVEAALPSRETTADLAEVFGLLGDAGRLRLLFALLEGGELCVCDLAATVEMSESATSHALRLLRTARVIKVRRSGRMAYYSLIDGHVRLLLDVALEHLRHGDQ